eukprot:365424-Chlamydomonas_euryale.AAC.5
MQQKSSAHRTPTRKSQVHRCFAVAGQAARPSLRHLLACNEWPAHESLPLMSKVCTTRCCTLLQAGRDRAHRDG